GRLCDLQRVRDGDDGALVLVAEPPQRLDYGPLVRLVELSGRLVGQHERRAAGGRRRDGDSLLLAARELRGVVVGATFQAELGEGIASLSPAAVQSGQLPRCDDVLERSQR